MRICIIIDDYMPNSIKIGAKMMHEMACEFVEQGHSVTVVTPDVEQVNNIDIVDLDGVTVLKFKSGKIKNVGKIKRAINELLLPYRAWNIGKNYFQKSKHDLIIYYSPTIFWGGLVFRLKKLWGAPSYLILRDFFPQWAVDQGLIKKKSLIEKFFRYFEKKNYIAADTIGLMSQKNLDYFIEVSPVKRRLEILSNWAKTIKVESKGQYRKSLGLQEKIVFFYGGNIGQAQDMGNIVRLAINMRKESKAHFVLVGEGDEVQLVRNLIRKEKLDNMTLLPSVSQSEFKLMLAEFDIGLFSLHPDHTTHSFPGKLLGYMVQNIPILGSVNAGNDLKKVVESANAGFVSVNRNDEQLLNDALKLLNEGTLRISMGRNAGNLLKKTFSVESAVEQIISSH